MPKNSAAKIAANNRYTAKTYEQIKALSRKDLHRADLIRIAAGRKKVSYQSYIVTAIDAALDADGISLDALPPVEDATTDSTATE